MQDNIDIVGQEAIEHLALKHAARERALPKSRAAIRYCANSIRATHRQEFREAQELIAQASKLIIEMAEDLRDHQDIYFAGVERRFESAIRLPGLVKLRAVLP